MDYQRSAAETAHRVRVAEQQEERARKVQLLRDGDLGARVEMATKLVLGGFTVLTVGALAAWVLWSVITTW